TGQPVAAPQAALAHQTLRILNVEDHPANRLLLCKQLGLLGQHCEMAENGAEGLELWKTDTLALVVDYCNMQVMNRY
ncbi:hybrid sensor histidine kinase/response regulator, partial [Pseudomonas syringae pv. tagetis]